MSFAVTAIVTTAVTVIGAGVSYYGAQKQADAQEKASYYNARNAAARAEEEQQTASENARRKRRDNKRRLSAIRARVGGSGLAFEGSSIDALSESASLLEREAGDMFRQGLARAGAYEQQGAMTLFEGGLQADATRTAATANLLSDVAGAATGGYKTYKGV